MRKIALAAAGALILGITVVPAGADGDEPHRDPVKLFVSNAQRYAPEPAGTEKDYSLLFGPFVIPPGHDANRITLDLPVKNGFMTAVAPDLVDAVSGHIPSEQHAHIHHAHWFEVTPDTPARGAAPAGLSWIFGTGEEKSQGRFDDREALTPVDPETGKTIRYGVPIDGTTPQVLIYMIHNKTSAPLEVFVALDVTLLHGTEAEIEAALPDVDVHSVRGTLWGQTRDAVPEYPELASNFEFPADEGGTAVAMGGHLHPGGKSTNIVNLGPNAACASFDQDGDGLPGVTLLNSYKYDRISEAGIYSEDYQIGVTKFGWRAPIHGGDVLRQVAPYAIFPEAPAEVPAGLAERYTQEEWDAIKDRFVSADGQPHAWYEAMTYSGIYVDYDAPPAPLPDESAPLEQRCALEHFAPSLLGDDTFETQGMSSVFPEDPDPSASLKEFLAAVTLDDMQDRYPVGVAEGMINHIWEGVDPLCGLGTNASYSTGPCEADSNPQWRGPGLTTDTIHIGGFAYVPGDLYLSGPAGEIPMVSQGTPLTLINDDAALNIRHTITSCPFPCNGEYVANYPLPDGRFDTGKLGNLDPIDGGLTGDDTVPVYTLETSEMEPGTYTYFCRIHPFMRGAFELIE